MTPTQKRVRPHRVAQVGGVAVDGEGWGRGGSGQMGLATEMCLKPSPHWDLDERRFLLS